MRTAINKEKIAKLELLYPQVDDDYQRTWWLILFKTEDEVIFNSIRFETEADAVTAFDQMIIDYGLIETNEPEVPPAE